MSYSSKHKQKPPCYGDPYEYDPKDRECRDCRYVRTCRIAARRRRREEEEEEEETEERSAGKAKYRSSGQRPNSVPVNPNPEEYDERDDEIGFWPALVANGALSGVRAGLVEATFAIDQIPRFPYPDPFAKAAKRGRRRAVEDEEDEEE